MSSKVSGKIARVFSTMFIPPVNLLIASVILGIYVENDISASLRLIIVTLIFGVIIPISVFIYLLKKKKVVNQDAVIKEERTVPYLIGLILYSTGFLILYGSITIISLSFWFSYIVNMLIILLINKYWKISAHALGIAGPFAAMLFVFGLNAVPFVLLVIIVGWSRLKLQCHTPMQVLAGTVLGLFSVYGQMLIINNMF